MEDALMESMTPKRGLGHAAGTTLVSVLILASALLSSCRSREETSVVRPLPPPVELVLGEQLVFHARELKGGNAYHFVSGKDGEFWVLRQVLLQPLMAARLGKGAEPSFEPISPKGWADVERVSVANTVSGNPVVVMMGSVPDARNTLVVVREYAGQKWTEPVQLDVFDGTGTFGSMVSLLDSKGRIHIAYDRRLSPHESYGLMHGYFPDKCFHAWSDGKNWVRAQSTTGKGKFRVDPRFLSELPNAKVCLGMKVHPFSNSGYKAEYVGCQLWDGKRWSSIVKDLPKEASSGADGHSVLDYWGNKISRASRDGKDYCVLKKRGSDSVETVPVLFSSLLKRDRTGRIVVCSWTSLRGEIRLWNGDRWAGMLSYPLGPGEGLTQILCNPDGNLFLIHKGKSRVVIQRIKLIPRKQDATSNKELKTTP